MVIDFTPDTTPTDVPKIDFQIDFTPDEVPEAQPDLLQPVVDRALGKGVKTFMADAFIPSFVESADAPLPRRSEPGIMGAIKDVAKGVPEGIRGLGQGLFGFLTGQGVSATQIPGDLLAGADPVEALSEAFDVSENVSEAVGFTPTTSTGHLLMKPIEAFFGTALGSVDRTVRELSDPNLPEKTLAQRSKAAQYIFNTALIGLPAIGKLLKEGKTLKATDAAEIKEKVKEVEPTFPEDLSDAMFDKLREDAISVEAAAKEAKKAEAKTAGSTTFEGNQSLVNKFQEEIDARTGKGQSRSRGAYVRARKIIEGLDGDIRNADLSVIAKGKNAKTRRLVEDWIKENPLEKVEADVPLGEVPKAELVVEPEPIVPVEEIKPEGLADPVIDLVKVPDVEPTPIQEFSTVKLAEGEGYKLDKEIFRTEARAQEVAAERGKEVVKVGKNYKVGEFLEDVVPEVPSVESVEGFKVMNEVSKEIAENDITEFAGDPEFRTVRVGDRYYRLERDVPIERAEKVGIEIEFVPEEFEVGPTEAELRVEENGIKELIKEKELIVEPEAQAPVRQAILDGYERYKKRYVEKINTEKSIDTKVEDPVNLSVAKDDFSVFKTREEAEAYREASNQQGREIIEDPLTGESYLEPVIEDIADYAWEGGLEEQNVSRGLEKWSDDPIDMELTDTGVSSLVDIFNNERGAIEFDATNMKVHLEKLRELHTLADRLGKSIPEVLESLGLSPEAIEGYMAQIARMPEDAEKVREIDPIIESLINPLPEEVIHQGVTNTRKGTVKNIPITKDIFNDVFGARKIEFGPGKLGKFFQATETRLHGFERYGKKVKELFWDNWTEKLTDSEAERKASTKINKELAKTLTKKERAEISIITAADQKGGKTALAADGITEIPPMKPKYIPIIKQMRKQYDALHDRINYVRAHVGLAPIAKIDNYFPFIHKQNALRAAGISDALTYTPLKKMEGATRKFNGTFFPFEKPRKVTDIPLELDIFDAYEKYLGYALKEIHVSPIAALAKEVSTAKIRPEGKKGRGITLADENPGLTKFLLEWSDEILGIDNVTAAQRAKHPFVTEKFNSLHRNIVAGMIFGNVGTVLKQPTAMIGTYSMTTLPDVIAGVTKMALGKTGLRKSKYTKDSNILGIRRAELILTEFAEAVSQGHIKGARKIAGDITSAPMNIVDALAAEASGEAGYNFARKKLNLEHKEAVRWADDLVAKTQAVGIKGAVSPIQTTAALKWLTMLQTFAIADFNFLARDVLGIKNPDIKKTGQVKRVLRYTIGAILVNEAFRAAGLDTPKPSPVRTFQESQEEGDTDTVATAKALKEFLELIPIVGGSAKFGSSLLGPVGELAQDIPETLDQVTSLLDWDNTTKKERVKVGMMVGEVLGLYYGIPMTRQIKKSIRTAMQGGNWYEIINGIYLEENKGGPGGPPSIPKPPKL